MTFTGEFIKTAEFDDDEWPRLRKSRATRDFYVAAQPKKYKLKYHPERRRYSCNCRDWVMRRQFVPDSASAKDKNCKHIKAFLRGKTAGQVRRQEVSEGYRFPKDKYFNNND